MDYAAIVREFIIPALIAFFIWRWQKNSPDHPDNIKAIEVLINELQEERNELKKEIATYKGERELLIATVADLKEKVATLEANDGNHEAERVAWQKQEAFLKATIAELQDQITDLQEQVKRVKRSTDELKKKTGQLPDAPDKK